MNDPATVGVPVAPAGEDGNAKVADPAREPEGSSEDVRDLLVAGKRPVVAVSPTPPSPADPATNPGLITLAIELIQGCLSNEDLPVVVVGQYSKLPPSGLLKSFDVVINSWISRAIELGIIGLHLGELYFIPIEDQQLGAKMLLIAGMGEPGGFTRDQLRLLTMNAVVAIKGLGIGRFGTLLMGSAPGGGLPVDRALRAVLDGVVDGMDRLPASVPRELKLVLAETDPIRFEQVKRILDYCKNPGVVPGLELSFETHVRECTMEDPDASAMSPPDLRPDTGPVIRFTISSSTASGPSSMAGEVVFQYSAISDTAVIPVREHEVKSYFSEPLPERIIHSADRRDQYAYGRLLATYLLPEDFLRLLEGDSSLSLILDSTSAIFPWEMAVIRDSRGMSFLGTAYRLTRQFRTSLSSTPGISPPLNHRLKVLIIADPAPSPYHLDGAREEGLAVVRAFALAREAWGDAIDLELTVRIGARSSPGFGSVQAEIAKIADWDKFIDLDSCDHLEILKLLLNDQFDVLHYAGHGIFDPASRRRGWVFDEKTILSATEIFLVPQVPRLVFANACHSSKIGAEARVASPDRIQQASLAEAFFARGIENYVGAGWEVVDEQAKEFSSRFYLRVLGIEVLASSAQAEIKLNAAAPPDTLGIALAEARRMLLDTYPGDTTWGAYQHYGQVNAKLLAFTNSDADRANQNRQSKVPPATPS